MSYINVPDRPCIGKSSSATAPSYLLDVLGTASASYSFKQLEFGSTVDCMRVRRSSDDTETDIGFVLGDFDVASYLAFIGGGNGFCTTLYDQSGAHDLVQATSALQPQIVEVDGRYVLKFDGGKFLRSDSFIGTTTNTTTSVIWKCTTNAPTGLNGAQGGIDFSANTLISPWWTTNQGMTYLNTSPSSTKEPIVSWESAQWRLNSFIFEGSNYNGYQFGIESVLPGTTTAPGFTRMTLGKNNFIDGNFYFTEVVVWPNATINKQTQSDQMKIRYPEFYPSPRDLFVVGGDSISTTYYCGTGNCWTLKAFQQTTADDWFPVVNGGWTLQNLIDNKEKLIWHQDNIAHTDSYCIIFAGTNDIAVDGQTGAQTYARLETLATDLVVAGMQVIVITPLPRYDSTSPTGIAFETARQAFSDLCVAEAGGLFLNVLDVRDLSIGVNGNQDTTTNYVNDYTHLNATGELILADAVADLINAL